jgi:radical SAM protein (TIGR01212 family)
MGNKRERYTTFRAYLEDKWGKTVYRLGVDASFSCPHRNADGSGGCNFCHEKGARNLYIKDISGLEEQIEQGAAFLEGRYGARGLYLYFQANTSTNADVEVLRQVYDRALNLKPFLGLIVSSRPDCLDEPKAALLAEYAKKGLDVWVELGLQSANNSVLKWMNRGHDRECFENACRLLERYGINVCVHLIFGLPGENLAYIKKLAFYMNSLDIQGVKVHNLNIVRGTELEKEYMAGEFSVMSAPRHLDYCVSFLERLNGQIVVMRLNTDIPAEDRVAPVGFWSKGTFYDKLRQELEGRDTWQGKLAEPPEVGVTW